MDRHLFLALLFFVPVCSIRPSILKEKPIFFSPYFHHVLQSIIKTWHVCQTHNPSNQSNHVTLLHPIVTTKWLLIMGLNVIV